MNGDLGRDEPGASHSAEPAGGDTPLKRVMLQELLRNQAVSLLLILLGIWAVLGMLSPSFFTVNNLFEITLQSAVIAIIAAGETFIIIGGGIDLSVGSVFACSAVVGGLLFQETQNLPLALGATIGFGGLLGLVNGTLVTRLRVPPFIATIAGAARPVDEASAGSGAAQSVPSVASRR